MPEPQVRARHLKVVVDAIDRHERRHEIRAAIGPTVLAGVEDATGTDWLPVAHDVAMAAGLHAALGQDGLDAFNREMMVRAMSGPLLRSLVELATSVFGLDAGSWIGWFPRAWGLTFRDCGLMTVTRTGPGQATVTLTGLPPVCAEDAIWPRSVASALSAILPAARAEGTVVLGGVEPRSGTAVYEMRWWQGRPAVKTQG